jgi:hypothetical protein
VTGNPELCRAFAIQLIAGLPTIGSQSLLGHSRTYFFHERADIFQVLSFGFPTVVLPSSLFEKEADTEISKRQGRKIIF